LSRAVLILTGARDGTAERVAGLVAARGQRTFFFDPGVLPTGAHLVFQAGGGRRRRGMLATAAGELDLDDVAAVWHRRPRPVGADEKTTRRQYFTVAATHAYYLGLLGTLDCPWLPGHPLDQQRADLKIEQLVRAEALGIEIPPTVVTNRRRDFMGFFHEQEGHLVSKISEPVEFCSSHHPLGRGTERVVRQDLAFLPRLRRSPVLAQAEIPKAFELRVTIVGERIFPVAILSQRRRRAQLDWRRDQDDVEYASYPLSPLVERQCFALLASFDLRYGTIDLIVRPDGQVVFLELNPNGQYLWLEKALGLPISEAIADLLCQRDPAGASRGEARAPELRRAASCAGPTCGE
jgi:glutathione synthase/RimK-type ligase-like ATP-grasp enzyme